MEPRTPILTRGVVAGGGPAGMMLGFLPARAGIDVVVLEKHADFFRDLRGDTIYPSIMQLLTFSLPRSRICAGSRPTSSASGRAPRTHRNSGPLSDVE